jgi:hypothetical protein
MEMKVQTSCLQELAPGFFIRVPLGSLVVAVCTVGFNIIKLRISPTQYFYI